MYKNINIIVLEDNLPLRDLIVSHLQSDGYSVHGFSDAEELAEWSANNQFNILLLDINLPGESGFDIASRLRQINPYLYIVMLTAKDSESDKLLGYKCGADVYLIKPISPEEISATILSMARRIDASLVNDSIVKLSQITMELVVNHSKVKLSSMEVSLLKGLSESPGQKLEHWQLLQILNKDFDEKSKAGLVVQIHRLRRKIFDVTSGHLDIKPVFNEGYQLTGHIQVI
jgi:DNA-binding response OmpR family regulator